MKSSQETVYHIQRKDWLETPDGHARGYIQSGPLKELWFHTGTICNLACPFCLEGSKPGDNRLNQMTLNDVQPFVEEALELNVQQFSFTGGEPFVVKDTVAILDLCLNHRPCHVLTNATKPLQSRLENIKPLLDKPHQLNFRVSFDYPDAARHDDGRGIGSFDLALQTIAQLHQLGFSVSVARHRKEDEDVTAVDQAFQAHFKAAGIPVDTRIVSFPDFLTPGSMAEVPHITEQCMTQFHTEASRATFMCHFSKMVVKKDGQMRVYACTLVDDDEDYDLGGTLKASLEPQIMLKHHRCYSCFALGASCSEI